MANKFVRRSALTDRVSSMMIDVSYAQVVAWEDSGELIQNAMPNLTDNEREFLMTGITPEEWDDMCGPEEPPCEGELKQAWYLNEVSKLC
tara:strand:- start:42 stop:311 length:270 start_codon:yes stop_codon:yes gene_type:complete